jgi:hypothetical protein
VPHTLAELNAWYVEPPAGQNAATFFLDGFDALQIGNVDSSSLPLLGKGALPPLGSPMPASIKSALSAIVHSNQEALQLFAEGASHEQSRYPLDLTRGLRPFSPSTQSQECHANRSCLPSACEANDGKQAANDVLIALALRVRSSRTFAVLSENARRQCFHYSRGVGADREPHSVVPGISKRALESS